MLIKKRERENMNVSPPLVENKILTILCRGNTAQWFRFWIPKPGCLGQISAL